MHLALKLQTSIVGASNVTLNHIIFHCLALVAMLHDLEIDK